MHVIRADLERARKSAKEWILDAMGRLSPEYRTEEDCLALVRLEGLSGGGVFLALVFSSYFIRVGSDDQELKDCAEQRLRELRELGSAHGPKMCGAMAAFAIRRHILPKLEPMIEQDIPSRVVSQVACGIGMEAARRVFLLAGPFLYLSDCIGGDADLLFAGGLKIIREEWQTILAGLPEIS